LIYKSEIVKPRNDFVTQIRVFMIDSRV